MTSPQPAAVAARLLRMDLRYDGTDFSGWAVQPGRRTVQGVLQAALETVLRLPAGTAQLTVAGRTDAGVHARAQVCSIRLPVDHPTLDRLTSRLNRLLPDDVVVTRTVVAAPGFDARFSASWRRYAYRICDRPAAVDPLRRREVLEWPRPLDDEAMNAAASALLGEHDFAAFCKRREGATTVRALRRLEWDRDEQLLTLTVVADAFCHHMVRSLVGCLLAVGEGRRGRDWPARILRAGLRDPGVLVVPAHGLCLEEVGYPADADLVELTETVRSRGARQLEPSDPTSGATLGR